MILSWLRRFADWWQRTAHPAVPVDDCDCLTWEEPPVLVAHLAERLMIGLPGERRTRWLLIPAICDADVILPTADVIGLVKPPPVLTVHEEE